MATRASHICHATCPAVIHLDRLYQILRGFFGNSSVVVHILYILSTLHSPSSNILLCNEDAHLNLGSLMQY